MSAKETMVERKVTYTLEKDGKFVIVENVPARVCLETGEQFFSPETVERLQRMILEDEKPKKVIQTPVYEFAA
jgi:YgiT-type zinc finger domain-containing protein